MNATAHIILWGVLLALPLVLMRYFWRYLAMLWVIVVIAFVYVYLMLRYPARRRTYD